MTSLSELLSDMDKLQAQLSRFETQFGVKSQDFWSGWNTRAASRSVTICDGWLLWYTVGMDVAF